MGQWDEAKQPRGLGGSPFSGGTIRQGNHHSLQILADNFEFANRFKLHGLACKVFLWCDGVGEYIQQERGGAGSVHAKCNRVSDYRLKYHVNCQALVPVQSSPVQVKGLGLSLWSLLPTTTTTTTTNTANSSKNLLNGICIQSRVKRFCLIL